MTAALVATPSPAAGPTLSIRLPSDKTVEVAIHSAAEALLTSAKPWRTFRNYKGQKHFSGAYSSVTEDGHVLYESRLELARALLADFDPDVRRIVAQPFLMRARAGAKHRLCRHVPDYLLVTSSGLTVVDAKPAAKLDNPNVAATFKWVRRVVEDVGWTFEVFTEPDPILLANIRFLAGYRRPNGISSQFVDELKSLGLDCMRFGDAVRAVDGPAPCVRAALLHLLWRKDVTIDLPDPLSASTVLREATT
jgi:hypothetical protein